MTFHRPSGKHLQVFIRLCHSMLYVLAPTYVQIKHETQSVHISSCSSIIIFYLTIPSQISKIYILSPFGNISWPPLVYIRAAVMLFVAKARSF